MGKNIKGRSGTLQNPWYVYAGALKKTQKKPQTKETYVTSISKIYAYCQETRHFFFGMKDFNSDY